MAEGSRKSNCPIENPSMDSRTTDRLPAQNAMDSIANEGGSDAIASSSKNQNIQQASNHPTEQTTHSKEISNASASRTTMEEAEKDSSDGQLRRTKTEAQKTTDVCMRNTKIDCESLPRVKVQKDTTEIDDVINGIANLSLDPGPVTHLKSVENSRPTSSTCSDKPTLFSSESTTLSDTNNTDESIDKTKVSKQQDSISETTQLMTTKTSQHTQILTTKSSSDSPAHDIKKRNQSKVTEDQDSTSRLIRPKQDKPSLPSATKSSSGLQFSDIGETSNAAENQDFTSRSLTPKTDPPSTFFPTGSSSDSSSNDMKEGNQQSNAAENQDFTSRSLTLKTDPASTFFPTGSSSDSSSNDMKEENQQSNAAEYQLQRAEESIAGCLPKNAEMTEVAIKEDVDANRPEAAARPEVAFESSGITDNPDAIAKPSNADKDGSSKQDEVQSTENQTQAPKSKANEGIPKAQIKRLEDISSQDMMAMLSARQIKSILTDNYVECQTICEKTELVSRLKLLWDDAKKQSSMPKDAEIEPEELCTVCLTARRNCVFLECGHLISCTDCGNRIKECPICRQYIIRIVRVLQN